MVDLETMIHMLPLVVEVHPHTETPTVTTRIKGDRAAVALTKEVVTRIIISNLTTTSSMAAIREVTEEVDIKASTEVVVVATNSNHTINAVDSTKEDITREGDTGSSATASVATEEVSVETAVEETKAAS